MLFVPKKKTSPFASKLPRYIILSPDEVSKRTGRDLNSVINSSPSFDSAMAKNVGRIATIVSGDMSSSWVRINIDGELGTSPYKWRPEFLQRVEEEEKAEPKDNSIEFKPDGKYKVILSEGEVVLDNVDASDICPVEEEEEFFAVNVKKYMSLFGASDWYIISSLCTTYFGQKDKSYVFVHGSCIIPAEKTPPELKPVEKPSQPKKEALKSNTATVANSSFSNWVTVTYNNTTTS